MLDRMKRALAESYVGAIALGWLFAQGILHFVYTFVTPIAAWIQRNEYRGMYESRGGIPTGFMLRDAVPDLIRSLALLLLGYLLLRWLYFKPLEDDESPAISLPSAG